MTNQSRIISKFGVINHIEIPPNILMSWQHIVDLMADVIGVPAGLIMRVHELEIEVLIRSRNPGNVYEPGETAKLDTGLYCETVMESRKELLVPNALKSPDWKDNPDVELDMISYLGLPLTWPTGEIFGTICILDNKENSYNDRYRKLLEKFRDSVQFALSSIYEEHIAVTKLMDLTRELEKSERELSLVFDNVPLAMFVVDQDRQILKANKTMKIMVGEERSVIGMRGGEVMRCIHRMDDPNGCGYGVECAQCGIKNMVLDTLENNASRIQEEHSILIEKNGEREKRYISASSVPLRNNNGNFALVITEDITTRKLGEKEKEDLQKQLVQSQKMETIGHLAGGVAHDFNNMLAIIMGATQLAMSELDEQSEPYQEQQVILDTAKRAKDLTSKLLTFARREEPKMKTLSINPIINDVRKVLERSLPKNIQFDLNLQKNLRSVKIDRNQIQQALTNICNNAADAMPNGGTISIKTNSGTMPGQSEHVGENDCCVIEITDTGIGMSQDIQDKVFDPFFTTKGVGKGTGLGMSVTHGIIRSHNGNVSVASEENSGTTILIHLPFSNEAVNTSKANKKRTSYGGSETILLIDDEEQLVKVSEKLLNKQGYKTFTATNGRDAIELFKNISEEIDIVVLDFIMPQMDAWDVFSALKKIKSNVNVLIASGYSEEGGVNELLKAGARGFVQKPFAIEKLCKSIRKVLDKETRNQD